MTNTERKLKNAGIELDGITISRNEVEIYVDGDHDATEEKMNAAANVLNWGGYRTGYGAWVLSKSHVSNGDYMDKGSRWHY